MWCCSACWCGPNQVSAGPTCHHSCRRCDARICGVLRARISSAGLPAELPAAWLLTASDGQLNPIPRLQQPAVDPVWYMREHGAEFGINIRNVMHIAHQVLEDRHCQTQHGLYLPCRLCMTLDWCKYAWCPPAQDFREMDVASMGSWQRLSDATCLWSLAISSLDASSHILVFRYAPHLLLGGSSSHPLVLN